MQKFRVVILQIDIVAGIEYDTPAAREEILYAKCVGSGDCMEVGADENIDVFKIEKRKFRFSDFVDMNERLFSRPHR
jgi:hypothetical protein